MTTLPNPRTMNNTMLADKYGQICATAATLKAQLEALKFEFLKRNFPVIDGRRYRLTRIEGGDSPILDQAKIQEVMPAEWIQKFSKLKHTDPYCRVSAITGARKAAKRTPAKAPHPALELETVS